MPDIFMQVTQTGKTEFILAAGLLVGILSLFLIFQAIVNSNKKHRLLEEKKILRETFDNQLLLNTVEVQQQTFEILGKELHDNIGQLLSTAKMLIGISERSIPHPLPETHIAATETLNKAINELRNISKSLDKNWVDKFDLYDNLSEEVSRIESSGNIKIHLNKPDTLPISPKEQFMLYRLMQEGISNVNSHAHATTILLNMYIQSDWLQVSIQDNGKGFNVIAKRTGLGIDNMIQRTKSLGGTIDWQSSSNGTKVIIRLPVKNNGL